ncbi:Hypothetical protein NTJ_13023 [Nesidiocoris tenuis]|uniref:Uncharacterized protein n=1 Tax=Nesidiocoris tenuis TaxID=355587 RepID=A0ABN7B738_9HEMI|nr:Hypothetical protein NTJ_13023 [Nesidiocoris tenuis]
MLRALVEWTSEKVSSLLSRIFEIFCDSGFSPKGSAAYTYQYNYEVVPQFTNRKSTEKENGLIRNEETRVVAPTDQEPAESSIHKRQNRRKRHQRGCQRANSPLNGITNNPKEAHDDWRNRTVTACPAIARYDRDNIDSETIQFGALSIRFSLNLRFLMDGPRDKIPSPPSYAQLVRDWAQSDTNAFWEHQLKRKLKTVYQQMEKWRARNRIFSVTVSGSPPNFEASPTNVLVRRIKEKMEKYFVGVLELGEVHLGWNGVTRRLIYIGPSKKVVEEKFLAGINSKCERMPNKLKGMKISKSLTKMHLTAQSTAKRPYSLTEELSDWEEKYWDKQIHRFKRKSGKANKKRLRSLEQENPVTKREMALMETKSASGNCDRKRSQRKRTNVTLEGVQKPKRSNSDSRQHEVQPSVVGGLKRRQRSKRMVIMEAKCRNMMRKMKQQI